MKTKSAKAKGRALQDWVRDTLIKHFCTSLLYSTGESEIRCALMGEGGADIKISGRIKGSLPYQFECKNQEKYKNIYDAYDQARSHGGNESVVVIKMNHKKPLAIMDADKFIEMLRRDVE